MKKIELVEGEEYFGVKFIRESDPKNGHRRGVFLCDCGEKFETQIYTVLKGKSKCGCRMSLPKHGYARKGKQHYLYSIWNSMIMRCHNPKSSSYSRYGARGIQVCDRWNWFENFLADMGERPSKYHSIDRIDNQKGYEPSNCRWATAEIQQCNTRKNHVVECNGERKTLSMWGRDPRVSVTGLTISKRLQRGWSIEKALFTKGMR